MSEPNQFSSEAQSNNDDAENISQAPDAAAKGDTLPETQALDTGTAKPEPSATPPRKTMNPSDVDLSKISALVVEDDAGGMAIIGVMMRFLNIKAYINTTGEGVVQMARAMHPRPDIVFCDINLPRTNGYEVLKELRSDPDLEATLIIAVTAQDADTEIPKAREAGFDGYIGKPLNRMRFPKQLRRILAGEDVWETY
jgi:two-component system, cell cycle response regulator DivK